MAIAADDVAGLVAFAKRERIDFVVVGPEAPLVLGLVDRLGEAGIKAFGPSGKAAALEGSKAFMKDLCAKYGIPTAAYGRFTDAARPRPSSANAARRSWSRPMGWRPARASSSRHGRGGGSRGRRHADGRAVRRRRRGSRG